MGKLKYFKLSNIKYLFHHHYWASEDLRVPVSRHYYDSTFGVRQRHDANIAENGEYHCSGTPGTGFFAHRTDSHSYQKYVRSVQQAHKNSFWNMVAGREPSYKREIAQVKKAIAKATDEERRFFLDTYLNCLQIGQQAELCYRLQQGVKDKVGHHLGKDAVSIITYLKSQVATLQHDMQQAERKPLETLTDEQLTCWQAVIEAFRHIVESRRLYSVEYDSKAGENRYVQVFADYGIFDFVWMRGDTPMLRDGKGNTYYFYPQQVIKAVSSTEFEIFDIRKLSIRYQPVDINTLSGDYTAQVTMKGVRHRNRAATGSAVTSLFGISHRGSLASIEFEQLGLQLLCSKPEHAKTFTNAMIELLKVMQ